MALSPSDIKLLFKILEFRRSSFSRSTTEGGCNSPCQMECCTSLGWMAKSVSSCAWGKHHSLGNFQERSLETTIKRWGNDTSVMIRWCNVWKKGKLIISNIRLRSFTESYLQKKHFGSSYTYELHQHSQQGNHHFMVKIKLWIASCVTWQNSSCNAAVHLLFKQGARFHTHVLNTKY